MSLKIGDKAPAFQLDSTSGTPFSLESVLGQACILYFYPRDFTSVCTKEACSFRDQFAQFRDLDVLVLGISRDSLDTHERFKREKNLPFDLLADTEGDVAKLYKVRIPILGVSKRVTYLLDKDHKIAAVHDEMMGHDSHVREMLKAIEDA